MQSFQQDCVDLAFRRYRRGEVDRRTLLAGLAALGVGTLTRSARGTLASSSAAVTRTLVAKRDAASYRLKPSLSCAMRMARSVLS